ncbi:plant lectins antimicrobial peptide [Colletotrichum chrysophilum]|uniref:Plant lectins antimicrobial peptide n=1 Tax=Colletotrichum chrysophilum TaxID=1836956 RepID=A0AAD9AYW2_9PEZI|nr:plant lectins antimicrobial peptide [Colletotrichum chrysophilum]
MLCHRGRPEWKLRTDLAAHRVADEFALPRGRCSSPYNVNGPNNSGTRARQCISGRGGNWCGDSTSHCGAGCQNKFGNCTAIADNISTDGRCGSNGKTCLGSAFGSCCSEGGWCGSEQAHCSTGCQTGFGNCTTSDGSTPPSDVSIDERIRYLHCWQRQRINRRILWQQWEDL